MKKLLAIALLFGTISSLGHFYLAKRTYQLEAGEASASKICTIGENINCDSALLSPYSRVFGISLSNFGLAFNLVLSVLLFFFWLFGVSDYWKNISFYLAGGIAFVSVVMAVISLVNHLFCPVCWALYIFSFALAVTVFFVFRGDLSHPVSFIKQAMKQKSSYILGAGLLLIGLFFHVNFVNSFDIKSQKDIIEAVFHDWQYEKEITLQPVHLLQKGSFKSNIVVAEFADFLCPMCKKVQPTLKNFLTHFPDVNFQFYVYPLDGICNSSIDFVQSGLSCELSKAIICAEKQKKGWAAHNFFFEKQSRFLAVQGNKNKIKDLFQNLLSQTSMDKNQFESCMKDPSTMEKVKQSALAGEQARIQGTPSFFINGKKVRQHSSKLLILRKAYEHLRKTTK